MISLEIDLDGFGQKTHGHALERGKGYQMFTLVCKKIYA